MITTKKKLNRRPTTAGRAGGFWPLPSIVCALFHATKNFLEQQWWIPRVTIPKPLALVAKKG